MTRINRLLLPVFSLTFGVAAMLLFLRSAFADPAPVATAAPGVDWAFWIAIASAIGTAVSFILHRVAAKTHNAKLEAIAQDLDEVRGLAGAAKPALAVVPASGTTALLAVLLLGALAAPALTSCANTRAAVAAGAVAFLDCEDGHVDAAALADMKTLADADLRHVIGGAAAPDASALKAELAPVKSDLGKCGWAAAVAAMGAIMPQPSDPSIAVSALVAAGPDPAQVRAAFAVAARQNGWPPVRVAGGVF